MKKILLILLFLFPFVAFSAERDGMIYLQVEENGEAWYVDVSSHERYFLGRPADAFGVMRGLGLGVSESDFASFNGYAPAYLSGRIILRVEENGEAYYIAPRDLKMHFLGRPADAFGVMRDLGVGISNNDLAAIEISPESALPEYQEEYKGEDDGYSTFEGDLGEIEALIFDKINIERGSFGLEALAWDEEVAAVARAHSEYLAEENLPITDIEKTCDFPMIHHEGFGFGLYNTDRLNNMDVKYFSMNGENIALVSVVVSKTMEIFDNDKLDNELAECGDLRGELSGDFKETLDNTEGEEGKRMVVEDELTEREDLIASMETINIKGVEYEDEESLAETTVQGWMNSPPHKENITEGEFDATGIGVAYVNGYLISTQSFIKLAECGYESGPCCEEEGYYPYCYEPLTCDDNYCVE